MPLHLTIENETSLPDGGPVSITVTNRRGIDIGRDQYLDWALPDPTRFISGKHCEVRYRDGRYWIQDVSTNGTFVNGSEFRLDGPYALNTGDRLEIGKYIVAVVVQPDADEQLESPETAGRGGSAGALWEMDTPAAPAINPQELRMPSISTGLNALDPLDWMNDLPSAQPLSTDAPAYDSDWQWAPPAAGSAPPPAVAPPAPPPVHATPAEPLLWTTEPVAPTPAPAPPLPQEPVATPISMPAAIPLEIASPPPLPPAQPVATVQPAIAEPAPFTPPPRAPMPAQPGTGGNLRAAFARGAGVDPSLIAERDDEALAELLGMFVRITTDNLRQLHSARAQSKGTMRSANMTMIQAVDNNPLRFSPTTEEALRILFGPPTSSYLSPHKSLESSFHDLKKHQVAVFSAMQQALAQLMEDLDPDRIQSAVESGKGVGALLRSRQTRLWEHYETVWKAKAGKSEHGMLDVFMRLFSESYDKTS